MKIYLKKSEWGQLTLLFAFACFALSPQAQAACLDGCNNGLFNVWQGDDALINDTTGIGNSAFGWRALFTDTTGSFNTAVGGGALSLNNGDSNTAVGAAALLLTTNGAQNTAVGTDAMVHNDNGSNNNAVGNFALFNNIDGFENNAFGNSALVENIHAAFNTAIGDSALWSNDVTGHGTANFNTAVGGLALGLNTDASENTAVGYNALADNDVSGHGTANFNTAIGAEALFFNGDANSNTAVGFNALMNNDIAGNGLANQNTAIGYQALFANTDGDTNTAIGAFALQNISIGSGNIALGNGAGNLLTDGDDNIYIGSQPRSNSESGIISIGDANTQLATFIAGISGTAVIGTAVVVNGNGQLGVAPSSERFKNEIKRMDKASEAILALKPVTFRYKKELDPEGTAQFGLVAEEVEKANPDLVARDDQGKPYTVRYEAVNAMLLNEFLKEHRKGLEQDAAISELKFASTRQQREIAKLTATVKEQALQIQKVNEQLVAEKAAPRLVVNE